MKLRQVVQGGEALILAHLGKEIACFGIALKTFGAEVKTGAQILERFIGFAKHGIERGKVIPWFGLVWDDGCKFFKRTFEFGQITHLCVKLGDDSNRFRWDVWDGQ